MGTSFLEYETVYLEEDDKTSDPEASKEGVVDHIEDCDL